MYMYIYMYVHVHVHVDVHTCRCTCMYSTLQTHTPKYHWLCLLPYVVMYVDVQLNYKHVNM